VPNLSPPLIAVTLSVPSFSAPSLATLVGLPTPILSIGSLDRLLLLPRSFEVRGAAHLTEQRNEREMTPCSPEERQEPLQAAQAVCVAHELKVKAMRLDKKSCHLGIGGHARSVVTGTCSRPRQERHPRSTSTVFYREDCPFGRTKRAESRRFFLSGESSLETNWDLERASRPWSPPKRRTVTQL
jgi:hypothetical protein